MPVVLRYRGYRFFFYAHEGDPREPVHIHVRRGNSEAKLWLNPFVRPSYNRGVPPHDLAEIIRFVQTEKAVLERAWHDFFHAQGGPF